MITMVVDDLVTCLSTFIHLSALISDNFPNDVPTTRFTNLKVSSPEKKTVSQRLQDCRYFSSLIFLNVELHLVQSY